MPAHVSVQLSVKYVFVLGFILQTLSSLTCPCIAVQIIVCFGLSKFILWCFFLKSTLFV